MTHSADRTDTGFRRELGLLDAAVVVAGPIIGVGIFANPANVARILGDPGLILIAWVLGGSLALLGGYAYAELGSRLPLVGGQYTYLARAYPPVIAFLYGVALIFILAAAGIVLSSFLAYPTQSLIGTAILLVAAGGYFVAVAGRRRARVVS